MVMNALALVLQLGINMLVPIFLCTFLGIWLSERTGITWLVIPMFFVGALAGGQSIYRLVKKFLKQNHK